METRNLEYFLQLAKYEHVSQTADLLNISQPSLSKSLTQLENELGVKLFDRQGRRIKLNETGRQFAHYIAQSLQLLDTAIFSAKSSIYDTLGQITIVCYCYAGIITSCVANYSQLNPYPRFIIIEPAQASESNFINKADFILSSNSEGLMEEREEQFWVAKSLFSENYVLIMADNYKEIPADTSVIDLYTFRDSPFITMIQENVLFRDFTYQVCQRAGFFPKVYCQTDSFLVKMNLIKSGVAIAILPESCLAEALELAPNLRVFQIGNQDTERTIYLMRRQLSNMTEQAQDFWKFAIDYFEHTDIQK